MTEHQLPPDLPPPSGGPPPLQRAPYGAGPRVAPHRGVIILILGIASWVTGCFVLGIIAWAMGNRDLLEMEEGRMDPAGLGMTRGGRITGMVHVIFSCVVFLIGIIVAIAIALPTLESGR